MTSTPEPRPEVHRTTVNPLIEEHFIDRLSALNEADSVLDCLAWHEQVEGTEVEHAIAGVRRLLQSACEGFAEMLERLREFGAVVTREQFAARIGVGVDVIEAIEEERRIAPLASAAKRTKAVR
jgi:hypothetical protein